MKLYNLFFFSTDELVDVNTILYLYTGKTSKTRIQYNNTMALNLTIVKIHNSQDKTLLCRNSSTFEDCGLCKHFPLSRRVVEN